MVEAVLNTADIVAAGGAAFDDLTPPLLPPSSGDRLVYDRGAFIVGGENSVPNPDFAANPATVIILPTSASASTASGTVQSWFGSDMPTSGATFAQTQVELVDLNGKRFLKLDQAQADVTAGVSGRVRTTVPIRPDQIGKPLEVSFMAAGYLPDSIVFGAGWSQALRVDIGLTPRRLSFIVPGEYVTSTNHTLNFLRNSVKATGKYALIGEVMVKDAISRPFDNAMTIPSRGVNIQLNRAGGPPSVSQLESYLRRIKQMGGLARVSLSVDGNSFSNFDTNSPPRWVSLKTGGAQLLAADAFMSLAASFGVQVIPTIIQSPGQTMTWHDCKSASSGYLDDANVAASYVSAVAAVVNRYKAYTNIIAWDIVNEGFDTNKVTATILATGNERLGYAAFESFYRSAYAAVKAADPNARVILTGGYSDAINGYESLLLDPSSPMADIVGYSLYFSSLYYTVITGTSPSVRQVSSVTGQFANPSLLTQGGLAEASPVYLAAGDTYVADGASIGSAVSFNTVYYLKDVDSAAGTFYLSATPGGARIAPLTGMSSGSGSNNILVVSADGSAVSAGQNVVRNMVISQRMPYIASEIGASGRGNVNNTLPYRIPAINAAHIRAYADILPKFGFSTQVAWDEYPSYELLTANNALSLNEAGLALSWSRNRSANRYGLTDLVMMVYASIRRVKTALLIGAPLVTVDGDGLLAVARKAVFGNQTGGSTNANLQIDSSSDASVSLSGFSGVTRKLRSVFDLANSAIRLSGANVALHWSTDGSVAAGSARVEATVTGVRISGDADVGDGSTAVQGSLLRGIYTAATTLTALGLNGALSAGQTSATSTVAVPGVNSGAQVDVYFPNYTLPAGVRFQGRCTSKGFVTVYVDTDTGVTLGNQTASIRAINV